ncbi:jg4044 [Pararge aegeria aegeria]|uniref:Jg4044 protein n=1 Tax=Pararge aegeria aegeria TaxID=348720 RepID=A0A8S4R7B1_9NEOP|nr:jg4044 [Pararge aegeria aegeria]
MAETEDIIYEDFYDELDNRIKTDNSMDIIFFGPPSSFLRLDAETILHLLSTTKKNDIPISRAILAWDIVTDGKTAAFLQGRELLAFERLLNVIPEEDLYYVDFGDSSVFNYFSKRYVPLHNRKFGILAAAYRRYYGNDWYKSASQINELGYLICGFPSHDLRRIAPDTFKELTFDVLSKLDRCNVEQTKVFIGRIPHDCFEDTLVPLFRQAGELFEFRLMINFSGWNRGYAFAMYTTEIEASHAIRLFNNYMIRPSWQLGK